MFKGFPLIQLPLPRLSSARRPMLPSCYKLVSNIHRPLPELLDWPDDGHCEIALKKPNACVENEPFGLIGGTKQLLPADGVQLIDVVCNLPSRRFA